MITVGQIQWVVGFLEGEGSFTCYKTAMLISVNQVQREPLERLCRYLGGKIYSIKSYQGSNKQPSFRWNLTGRSAAGLMMTVYCEMSPRRQQQIKKALAAWRVRPEHRNTAKTKCPRGHPYNYKSKSGRRCTICDRARSGLTRG